MVEAREDPDKIAPHLTAGQALYNKYSGIATKLGYKPDEFEQAFQADPDKVIQYLQRKAAEKAENDGPLTQEQIDQAHQGRD